MQFLYIFLITAVVMLALDAIWLLLIMAKVYRKSLSTIGRFGPTGAFAPKKGAILVVYIAMVTGFLFYVFPTIVAMQNTLGSFVYGAVFGILVYAIYEFTNYAGLKDWPKKLVLVDTIWGGILFGLTSVIVPRIIAILNI